MKKALNLASDAALLGEVPVGAVVFRGDTILGEGCNRKETDCDPSAHAEIVAMRQAALKTGWWSLEGCDIAVTLEPCPMCAGALLQARMRSVYFGASDPRWGACGSLYDIPSDPRFNHRCKVTGGVLEGECVTILREFFQARRKV